MYNINLIPENDESEKSDNSGQSKEAKSFGVITHDVSIGDEFKEHEIKSLQNFSKSTSSRSDSSSDLPDDVKGNVPRTYGNIKFTLKKLLELISKPEMIKVDEDQNASYTTNSTFENDRKIGSKVS